jgi:hypothetical protein
LSSLEAAGSSLAVEPIAVSRVDEFMIGDFY